MLFWGFAASLRWYFQAGCSRGCSRGPRANPKSLTSYLLSFDASSASSPVLRWALLLALASLWQGFRSIWGSSLVHAGICGSSPAQRKKAVAIFPLFSANFMASYSSIFFRRAGLLYYSRADFPRRPLSLDVIRHLQLELWNVPDMPTHALLAHDLGRCWASGIRATRLCGFAWCLRVPGLSRSLDFGEGNITSRIS